MDSVAKLKNLDLTKYTCHHMSSFAGCKSFLSENSELLKELVLRAYEAIPGNWAKVANIN